MSLPQVIQSHWGSKEECAMAARWLITRTLAHRLISMAGELPFDIRIISGHRTEEEQNRLREAGRPTAPNDRSTHVRCPASGADITPLIASSDRVKLEMGRAAVVSGLQWGGRSPIDNRTGIPSDWQHVDLGPLPS